METKIDQITEELKKKACKKQAIYRHTLDVFNRMKELAKGLVENLSVRFQEIDKYVKITYKEVSEFEFYVMFSGDLLMFNMHSNIVTLPHENIIFKSPYILEDPTRAYFGTIMVYNFMADSLKYNRLNDPGYLMTRMMVNRDSHFYIEGVRQMAFLYPDIAQNHISDDLLQAYIENSILLAIENDLFAPQFHKIQVVPLGQKLANQILSTGNKVGFQMSYHRK